jgi:hypothetical protein
MTFENILRGKFTAKIKGLSFHKVKNAFKAFLQ